MSNENNDKNDGKCEVFTNITQNAIDFIQKAVGEFDEHPKYSLIHFATGIELLLKARLAHEHWTLIADKDNVSYANLLSGEPKTIRVEDLRKRINSLFPGEVAEKAFQTFENLAKYRNRVVHFAFPNNAQKEIAKILCQTWYHIHELLTNRWQNVFSTINPDIEILNSSMMQYRKYLEEKYEKIKPQIENNEKKGIEYNDCPSCGCRSLICEEVILGEYFSFPIQQCCVCGLDDTFPFKRACPKCKKEMLLSGKQDVSCPHCNYKFSPEELCDALDTENMVAWCGYCETKTAVCLYGDWFCTNCFDKIDESDVSRCEYCNELIAGEVNKDYYYGCFLCGGKHDVIMADDSI